MNYIVFDLEWNQSPHGKKYSDSRLPFEIIEIGGVKLNEELQITDHFHRLIKPQVYDWIHESIHEVIHVDYKDLEKGSFFTQAVREFLDWSGEDGIFFTWGNQDVMELQRNMKYYDLLSLLPGPVKYYDVQKLFGLFLEGKNTRRALEYAIDQLNIDKTEMFHRALSDACYTAEILKQMKPDRFLPYFSLDVYQNPKSKKEQIHISYPSYDRYVSREFQSREKIMKDRWVTSTLCPLCRLPARRKIRWFMNNSKIYYSLSLCHKHGYVEGKIRIRKTEEEQYFAIKTIKHISMEESEELRQKRESLRLKKKLKKDSKKEVR